MGVEKFNWLGCYLARILPGINKVVVNHGLIFLEIDSKYLRLVSKILGTHCQLKANSLIDIWGVDYPEQSNRFQVNYMFLSIKYNVRIVVRCVVGEFEGLESLSASFSSAGWLEREVWDMFGVMFYGHKDLRRILTDYGFDGHPLRKDFPLSGFMEVRYDDGEKRVVYEPLEVAQEYRLFNFKSPWERL